MVHANLWDSIYEGCLEAAQALGEDRKKLSWFPKNRLVRTLELEEQQKKAA